MVAPDELVKAAKDWIKAGGKAKNPWDVEGFRLPGGPVYSKAGMMTFPAANAIYRRETYDNYPAARAILQVVYEGLQLPIDLALRVESRWFAKILRSPEAAAMMRSLFVSMQDLNKGARRPADVPPAAVQARRHHRRRLHGREHRLCDGRGRHRGGADRPRPGSRRQAARRSRDKLIAEQVNKGRATRGRSRRPAGAHHARPADYARARRTAISSSRRCSRTAHVKAETYAKAQAAMAPDVIFGSNTSTLPITSLAQEFSDPSRFIGIHFFSPVERMMLVEIILGKDTGDAALATALDYVRAIRKTPIVVNDSRGFYTSRVVGTYLREGHLMLTEGVPAAMIENVGRMAGMPVGPLALNDEVAVDLAWKILKATEADLGAGAIDPRAEGAALRAWSRSAAATAARTARASTTIRRRAPKRLWPGLADLQPAKLDPDTIDVQELKDRLLGIQALETARCFEENVLTDVREADVGSILGFGFAPFSGGTLSYIDMMGTQRFVALCEKLAAKHGPRFAPSPLLLDMAARNELFYGRFAPERREKAA